MPGNCRIRFPDTTRLVNLAWRALDSQVRRAAGKLTRQHALFAAHTLTPKGKQPRPPPPCYEQKKGAALSALEATTSELDTLKTQRKATPNTSNSETSRPNSESTNFAAAGSTSTTTSNSSPTAPKPPWCNFAHETLKRADDGRSFVRGLMNITINPRPDLARGELRVELQGQANPHSRRRSGRTMHRTQRHRDPHYPGTKLRLNYVPLRSSRFPGK